MLAKRLVDHHRECLCAAFSRRRTTPPSSTLLPASNRPFQLPDPLLQDLILSLDFLKLRPVHSDLLIPWRANNTATSAHLNPTLALLAADALPVTWCATVNAQW